MIPRFCDSVVSSGSAGSLSCWGQSPVSLRGTLLLSHQPQERTGAGLQVPAVSCKPETWHSSSFRAGTAPAQQTRTTGSQDKVLFIPHHRFDSSQTKTWRNQNLKSCEDAKSEEPAWSRACRGSQQAGAPGQGQAWLLLMLSDRKSVTNMRCPDRRRLRRSPRQRLRSGAGAARAGLSGALRVTVAPERSWQGLGGGRALLL